MPKVWSANIFKKEMIQKIKQEVGDHKAQGLSGGVDSTVTAK